LSKPSDCEAAVKDKSSWGIVFGIATAGPYRDGLRSTFALVIFNPTAPPRREPARAIRAFVGLGRQPSSRHLPFFCLGSSHLMVLAADRPDYASS